MNISSLDELTREINLVRKYLTHIKYVNELTNYFISETDNKQIQLLLENLKEHDKNFRTDKRIFEYKAVIISLYALIEKYVEIWIKEYLDSLAKLIPDYNQLDDKIRNNHFELSLKLMALVNEGMIERGKK
ncbi:HEPN domain-containing protein [Geminocystis sp. NIES-3708]|uniref:HEPN domain-containing protein n=1 Tax=Geminocystis sp. NIES-3708 TaxID=1615909 RepID=UPI00082AE929|nr:HEPN domain-containing protein [Geminocystis sp. NIES-3708]